MCIRDRRKPGALRNGAPFLEMPLPLQKLQLALRQRERLLGDRMMANVLTQVRNHGLEAVTIAVEQVLASGVTSIEHLQNILSRLNTTAMPAPVAVSYTHLKAQGNILYPINSGA